jgi:hypothetical protein
LSWSCQPGTHARAHATAVHRKIAALLVEAQAAGELGAEPGRLAHAIRSLYQGTVISWALAGDGALARAVQGDLETLLAPYLKENR